jgi:GTP-binding protein Era
MADFPAPIEDLSGCLDGAPGGQSERCGYLAIIGRPNVGKSTLLNKLVGEKVSITAHKPQTTRHQIAGIRTDGAVQYVFLDTPGMHLGEKRALNRILNRTAAGVIGEVDGILFVSQAPRWTEDDQMILERLKGIDCPTFAVINKIDRLADKRALLPFIQRLSELRGFREIVPISARTGTNLQQLLDLLAPCLPAQPHIFAGDQLTDRSACFLAGELVREQLIRVLGDELPYTLTVDVEDFKSTPALVHVRAMIWVERAPQKPIVIGKKGERLKEVGTRARRAMEKLFAQRVNLQLWVKVNQGWSDDEQALRRLGYGA